MFVSKASSVDRDSFTRGVIGYGRWHFELVSPLNSTNDLHRLNHEQSHTADSDSISSSKTLIL